MANSEDRQRELVRAFIEAGGKMTHAMKIAGASHNAINRAVGNWRRP